mmetsp:Transcript_63524/g.184201  ORF Transcript_63524/g.184201 Transcript_63524/m.184201 type:complete len:219 (-) Transcript_63524:125-781(-)
MSARARRSASEMCSCPTAAATQSAVLPSGATAFTLAAGAPSEGAASDTSTAARSPRRAASMSSSSFARFSAHQPHQGLAKVGGIAPGNAPTPSKKLSVRSEPAPSSLRVSPVSRFLTQKCSAEASRLTKTVLNGSFAKLRCKASILDSSGPSFRGGVAQALPKWKDGPPPASGPAPQSPLPGLVRSEVNKLRLRSAPAPAFAIAKDFGSRFRSGEPTW